MNVYFKRVHTVAIKNYLVSNKKSTCRIKYAKVAVKIFGSYAKLILLATQIDDINLSLKIEAPW